jgi:hypothetical protein
MIKPSPADISIPALTALIGNPTGATMSRSGIAEPNGIKDKTRARQPTNALRESNRQDTGILYRQAGINAWLNAPYALNIVLVSVLGIMATGLVYLVR